MLIHARCKFGYDVVADFNDGAIAAFVDDRNNHLALFVYESPLLALFYQIGAYYFFIMAVFFDKFENRFTSKPVG